MSRTNSNAVKAVLMDSYGAKADATLPDLSPFIDSAAAIVDRVELCAIAKARTLTAAELELIERWLSAHCYAMSDQPYSARTTAGASGTFQGQTGMYLEATKYGQQAVMLDSSGCLAALGKRQTAGGFWLGKPPSEQIDYADRS